MENLNSEQNIVKSALKIFHVLELVIEQKLVGISELSRQTSYSKSTIQRIINTLKYLRYIDQDPSTNEYFPTLKLLELSYNISENETLKNLVRPHLMDLYEQVNETVNLGILNNDNIIYLDKIVSKSPLRVELEIGSNVPLYCSALGKSIAAFSDEKFEFGGNYIKYTENTISSDKELFNHLMKIRETGYALDNEEYIHGLVCIGVPLLNKSNHAIASISISKPAIRFNKNDIDIYVSLLRVH